MPPGMALIVTLHGSNYRCLEQIFMVPKGFEPSKFDCTVGIISQQKQVVGTNYKHLSRSQMSIQIQYFCEEIHVKNINVDNPLSGDAVCNAWKVHFYMVWLVQISMNAKNSLGYCCLPFTGLLYSHLFLACAYGKNVQGTSFFKKTEHHKYTAIYVYYKTLNIYINVDLTTYCIYPKYWDRQTWPDRQTKIRCCRTWHLIKVYTVSHSAYFRHINR